MKAQRQAAAPLFRLRSGAGNRAECPAQAVVGRGMDSNEKAVLAGLTRALLDSGARSATLSDIFEGCGRRIPAPVLVEVLERLAEGGLVRHAGAGAEVVQLVGAAAGPPRVATTQAAVAEAWWITESGFLAHNEVQQADATALAATLPARLAAEGIGPRERGVWAELHDYLSWRPERSVHLVNFGLGHRLGASELRRFQEAMLRLGLLERAQAETHYRLTELGRRIPRLPATKE
jgi:hypothetical protein